MMTKLMAEVKELIEKEYGRAGAQHGLTFTSDHQAYAVILEECEEALESANSCQESLRSFWRRVKLDYEDPTKLRDLEFLYKDALCAACEFIQVAAMAKKSIITINDRKAAEELKE